MILIIPKSLIMWGILIFAAGTFIAFAGTLSMIQGPPLLPTDFEVTARSPVPSNTLAILVPFGLIVALTGIILIMIAFVFSDAEEP